MTVTGRARTGTRDWQPRIAVIGAGLGGIATAVKLKKAGLNNFTVFERSAGPGGVWWDNRYPGAEVDTSSHSYSYSFKTFNWSRSHAQRDEILRYIEDTIDEFGLRPHLQFSVTVTSMEWEQDQHSYRIRTNRGSREFEFVITAVGHLNLPQYPSWPGLESFSGPAFHTSQWEGCHDLRGKRVAVVGTGSTAAQVVSALAELVGHLYVFQRDPHWVEPKPVHGYTHREQLARTKPWRYKRERLRGYWTAAKSRHGRDIHIAGSRANDKATRRCKDYIASTLSERPDLEKMLTPDYPYFGKRPVKDSNFYEALKRPNVELVGHAVSSVTVSGLVDVSGTEHAVDCIVAATGFQASRFLAGIDIRGRDGHTLHQVWGNEPCAFAGCTVPGFPNFFMVYGPNTDNPLVLFALERQAEIAVRSIKRLLRRGATSIEVRPVYHDLYNRWLQRQLRDSVWASVDNYYKSSTGRVVTEFPRGPTTFWIITRLIAPLSCKLAIEIGDTAMTTTDRMISMPGLSERVVILTGAASGIGAAAAHALVDAGSQVMLVDRDADGLEKISNSFDPGQVSSLVADIGAQDAPEQIVSTTLSRFDALTTLLHVAGVYHRVSVPNTTRHDFDNQLAVNVQAPFWLTQAALPHLTDGQVVFVGSTAAHVGSAEGTAYCASKAAVLGMMRALAVELAPHGVRINAISPGTTNTPINDGWLFGENRQVVVNMIPDGRIGRPDDIVGALLFLISDLADHIHGHSVVIDGGLTIK